MSRITNTNCQLCWLDGGRLVPAAWAQDDDFYCEAHRRAESIEVSACVPIAQYRRKHGLTEPVAASAPVLLGEPKWKRVRKRPPRGLHSARDLDVTAAEQEIEEATSEPQEEQPMKTRTCKADGCETPITEACKSGYCGEHWHFSKKVPQSAKGKHRAKAAHGKAITGRLIASKDRSLEVKLHVSEAWLEHAWSRLTSELKSVAIAAALEA